MSVFIYNVFECRKIEDDEYIGKEDIEVILDNRDGENYFKLRSRSVGYPEKAQNRTVTGELGIEDLEKAHLKRIVDVIDQWLESKTRSSVTVEIGQVNGNTGYHGDFRDFDLLSLSVSERGVSFLMDQEDAGSVYCPPSTKEIDGEHNNLFNIKNLKNMIEEYLYTYQDDTIERLDSDSGVLSLPLNELDEQLKERCIPMFERGEYSPAAKEACQLLEERVRETAPNASNNNYGKQLMTSVFSPENGSLSFGEDMSEKEGILHLYTGTILALRNPLHHRTPDPARERYLDSLDRQQTHGILCYINFLLNTLDENS